MDLGGYVCLYRKLLQSPVWTTLEPGVLKVMLACLFRAHWKAATWYDGATEIDIPRGSFITSYPKMAALCNLTQKQVRGAFAHLESLQFTTYTRGPKWTMVRVLNYDFYQPKGSDFEAENGQNEGKFGGTPKGRQTGTPKGRENGTQTGSQEGSQSDHVNHHEASDLQGDSLGGGQSQGQSQGQLEGRQNGRQEDESRAPYEETITKEENNTYASDDANGGFSSNEVPLFEIAPIAVGQPRKGKPYLEVLRQTAKSIHDRHPSAHRRRNLSLSATEKALEAILKHKRIPTMDCEAYLRQIDRVHAANCVSDDWRKDNHQYTPALRNYLAATVEQYDVEMVIPKQPRPASDPYTKWEPPTAREA